MSYKLVEKEFSKLAGRTVSMVNGKRKVETKTTKVKLFVPEIELKDIKSVQDIAKISQELLDKAENERLPGFKDLSNFVEIFNVGCVASIQRSLRTGADVRRSEIQNRIFRTYRDMVLLGAMTPGPNSEGKPDALELLKMSNMGDAIEEFLASLEPDEDDDSDMTTVHSPTQKTP